MALAAAAVSAQAMLAVLGARTAGEGRRRGGAKVAAAKRDCEAVRAGDCTAENCVSGQGERCCSTKNVLEVVNQIGVYDGGGDNHCRLRLKAKPSTRELEG